MPYQTLTNILMGVLEIEQLAWPINKNPKKIPKYNNNPFKSPKSLIYLKSQKSQNLQKQPKSQIYFYQTEAKLV